VGMQGGSKTEPLIIGSPKKWRRPVGAGRNLAFR